MPYEEREAHELWLWELPNQYGHDARDGALAVEERRNLDAPGLFDEDEADACAYGKDYPEPPERPRGLAATASTPNSTLLENGRRRTLASARLLPVALLPASYGGYIKRAAEALERIAAALETIAKSQQSEKDGAAG